MKIVSIKEKDEYLNEYVALCSNQWGKNKTEDQMKEYVKNKKGKILNGDKVISILGLTNNDTLIGFISLFKYDGDYRRDLTPWYATIYVKKEYRGLGYSKILNDAILEEASKLGYDKVYLKSDLINYYEKFGAKYIEKLDNGENLYYIDLRKKNDV